MEIKGYKKVDYTQLQEALHEQLEKSHKEETLVTYEVGVKSIQTVRNAFNKGMQITSDEVLTKVMKVIDFNGFILWDAGQRSYYIKN